MKMPSLNNPALNSPYATGFCFVIFLAMSILCVCYIFLLDAGKECYANSKYEYPSRSSDATEQNKNFKAVIISLAVIYFIESLLYLKNFFKVFK